MCMNIHVWMDMCVPTVVLAYDYVCLCVYGCVSMLAHAYKCVYLICRYMFMHTYIDTDRHKYTRVYVHTHTHSHRHTDG